MLEFLGLLLIIAGFVIGLGAVTVIDIHGFLSIKSKYWTEATTRTHKVTKPMIWAGVLLLIAGGVLFYLDTPITQLRLVQIGLMALMVLNGLFLTFKISPYLIKREEEGKSNKLLPRSLQIKIALSFVFSVIGWWGEVLIFVWYLANNL